MEAHLHPAQGGTLQAVLKGQGLEAHHHFNKLQLTTTLIDRVDRCLLTEEETVEAREMVALMGVATVQTGISTMLHRLAGDSPS